MRKVSRIVEVLVWPKTSKEGRTYMVDSAHGVATGVAKGQSATPDSEKFAKNRGKSEKNQEKSGKYQEKSGKKRKNRKFTLPLLR